MKIAKKDLQSTTYESIINNKVKLVDSNVMNVGISTGTSRSYIVITSRKGLDFYRQNRVKTDKNDLQSPTRIVKSK